MNKKQAARFILTLTLLVFLTQAASAYDVEDTLAQGETKNFVIDGREYSVTADFIGEDFVLLTYNGEKSEKLARRDDQEFSDNTTIVIKEILVSGERRYIDIGLFLGEGREATSPTTTTPAKEPTLAPEEAPTTQKETTPTTLTEQAEEPQPETIPLPAPATPPTTEEPASLWQRIIDFFKNLFS